ncbi:MAG: MerR family transcriptional regulator [Cellulosilyticaceae bacterium]
MKQYYKIGEISKIYGIGKDSLMYYEEIGILSPMRDQNGYRLYHISDIWRLNLIKELRTLDFPMKKIKAYLDERTVETTKAVFHEELVLIEDKIQELNRHKKNICERLEMIQAVLVRDQFETIQRVSLPKRKALILNANITRDEDVDFLIQKLQKEYEDRFYILGNHNIGAVFNLDKLAQNIYTEFQSVFCLLEEEETVFNFTLPEGDYVSSSYRGKYKKNREIIPRMFGYIQENNMQMIGNPIEIYKIDIHETGNEEEFVTEIQIPVQRL